MATAGTVHKKQGKRQHGYDLSGRRPGPGHLKHKYAASDARIDEGIKTFFFENVQATKAAGGARRRVCGAGTAQMHWNALKYFLGYLEDCGCLDDLPEPRVHPAELLSSTDMLKAYYTHLEKDATCRGTPFSPGAIQLATRSLAVLMQARWNSFNLTVSHVSTLSLPSFSFLGGVHHSRFSSPSSCRAARSRGAVCWPAA